MNTAWRILNGISGQYVQGKNGRPRLYTETEAKEACKGTGFCPVGPHEELDAMAKKKAKGSKSKPKASMPKGSVSMPKGMGMKKGKGCS